MTHDTPTSFAASPLLDNLTKSLGVATALLLLLSTAFDFSYLYSLGLAFEDVPTNLSDHVRSALVWTPKAVVYALIFALYEMAARRLEGGQSEEELIRLSPHPRFTRWFRKSPAYLFGAVVVISLITDFFLTNSSRALYVGALVAWGTLASWVVRHERLGAAFSQTGRRLFLILPLLGIWVGLLGYGQGRAVLEQNSPNWTVVLKTEDGTESHELLGLRRFSTSAVLVAVDRKVSVVPNEMIVSTSLVKSKIDSPNRLCSWFAVGCKSSVPAK